MDNECILKSKNDGDENTNLNKECYNGRLTLIVDQKLGNFKRKLPNFVKCFSSYDIENFNSVNNFVEWMHRPTDAASLGLARMLFGIVMLIDIPDERGGGNLDLRYGDPKDCHFPLLDFLYPLPLPQMGIVYLIMWIGAMGIALGYKFRISCLMFVIPYWYIFLLNKVVWNNHSYLYGLCGLLFLFTNANRFCSLDYQKLSRAEQVVPYWNYFLIKFQFVMLYFLAGLKKMSIEWLSGYAMTNLGYHWVFAPFRLIMGVKMTELLIIHWFGAIFDLTIAFLLIWEKTRVAATPFAISFHLMNSRLFAIGMFPWLCLVQLPLFYKVDWPRTVQKKITRKCDAKEKVELDENFVQDDCDQTVAKVAESTEQEIRCRKKSPKLSNSESTVPKADEGKNHSKITVWQKLRVLVILAYCCLQFFLPYSHFITKGYNNWTNGLYGYSWDMMVHAYDTILTSIKIIDNNNNEVHYLEPYAFTDYDRWTKHADMAKQYSKCIERNLVHDYKYNPKTILTSTNLSIYFDIWCSMNGRFQQRVFDPRVDLLKAEWSAFKSTEWILPLLNELTYMRPKLDKIMQHVLSWNNHTDVLFIADFPDLVMGNFISPDLDNVTLTVLEGAVELQHENSNDTYSLSLGQALPIRAGEMHKVKTISSTPSCYMYTYVNRTMEALNIDFYSLDQSNHPMLPLWDEFMDRVVNYQNFLSHVGNSILFLVYGVPMPRRIRDHN